MLVDFTVENYRSVLEPVTLSAVEVKRGSGARRQGSGVRRVRTDDEIAPPHLMWGGKVSLLPVIAVFGPNASGKSNLLAALDFTIRSLHQVTALERADEWSRPQSFLANGDETRSGSRFELTFADARTLYRYEILADASHYTSEVLRFKSSDSPRWGLIFETELRGSSLKPSVRLGESFKEILKPAVELWRTDRHPFACFAVGECDQLKPMRDWASSSGKIVELPSSAVPEYVEVVDYLFSSELRFNIQALSKYADLGISGLERRPISPWNPSGIMVRHESSAGAFILPFEQESRGTQRLLFIAAQLPGPLRQEGLVIHDDMDAGLHPHLSRSLVELFQRERSNPNRSQLVLVGHQSQLMSGRLLRRDQIWLTDKTSEGSTRLKRLSDFRVRNDLAVEGAYLQGLLGGVPILGHTEDLREAIGVGG